MVVGAPLHPVEAVRVKGRVSSEFYLAIISEETLVMLVLFLSKLF